MLPEGLIEVRVWEVPIPVWGSQHRLKYSAVYVVNGQRVVGFDNERGKGDHKHVLGVQYLYIFRDLPTLLDDFEAEVVAIRGTPI